MKLSKEVEQKVLELQLFEQNLQNILMQKQSFEAQLSEIENATKEVKATKEDVFKVVGNIMIKAKKNDILDDLKSKKEVLDLRVSNLEKQESKLREKASKLQAEVVKDIEK